MTAEEAQRIGLVNIIVVSLSSEEDRRPLPGECTTLATPSTDSQEEQQ
jgi:hypothetical protein